MLLIEFKLIVLSYIHFAVCKGHSLKIFMHFHEDVVSNEGQFPIEKGCTLNMMSTGPLCRYAEDLIPFLKVVTLKEFENQLKLDHRVNLATSLLPFCKCFVL